MPPTSRAGGVQRALAMATRTISQAIASSKDISSEVTGRLAGYADYIRKIGADCISLSYGMFRPQDVDDIHSAGASIVMGGLWNANTDLFRQMEIDIFNHGNPSEAKKILPAI